MNGDRIADQMTRFRNRLLQSELLSSVPGIAHGVTSRVEGAGLAHGNIGYGAPRDRADAWSMRQDWCHALGVEATRLATAHQVHGTDVLVVAAAQAGHGAQPGSTPIGIADALISCESGVVLMTLHADCLPILLIDPGVPAIAAVHAGWRGTVLDAPGAAVDAMVDQFKCRPDRMLAFLGPAVGPCCYEIGDEVVDAWQRQADGYARLALRSGPRRQHLDLATANHVLLRRAGLSEDHIETSPICTRCCEREWFSHRGQGAHTGRFGAMIALIESTR